MDVEHGHHLLTRGIVRLMRLPEKGLGQDVKLSLRPDSRLGEIAWSRNIGCSRLATRQTARSGRLVESSGCGSVVFELVAEAGSITYRQVAMKAFGLTIPRKLSPRVVASVSPTVEGWHVKVEVSYLDNMICRYEGDLKAR